MSCNNSHATMSPCRLCHPRAAALRLQVDTAYVPKVCPSCGLMTTTVSPQSVVTTCQICQTSIIERSLIHSSPPTLTIISIYKHRIFTCLLRLYVATSCHFCRCLVYSHHLSLPPTAYRIVTARVTVRFDLLSFTRPHSVDLPKNAA